MAFPAVDRTLTSGRLARGHLPRRVEQAETEPSRRSDDTEADWPEIDSVDPTETRCGESGAGYLRAPEGVPHRPRPPPVRPIGPATRSGGRTAEYPAPSRHRLASREATEDRLAAPTSGGPDRTVLFSVVHGLHDEA